jgi:TPR repeat protein
VILAAMKAALLLTLALATSSTFAQYSARTLTSKVVPQPQPAPARPVAPLLYAPAPTVAAPQRAQTPAELAKVKADKSKNEVKQFEFFKRRAEEGSDHAQYELAMRYLNGKGTDPSEKLAREWLAKSAKQGYSQATKKLAELGPETPEASELKVGEVKPTSPPATPVKKVETK